MKLTARIVEKPWGRTDVPIAFGDVAGRQVGEIWFETPANHPASLMIKFLFTSERLSIQVHPDDAQATTAGFARGKDECWLILDADADAELAIGLKEPCSKGQLQAAAASGAIVEMVDWRSAHAGQFIYNRAGTIHALGAGLTVVEVQQNVDCTYRLYDYGRLDSGQPRTLHLDQGLAVARREPHHDDRDCVVPNDGQTRLVDGPYFSVVRAHGPIEPGSLADAREIHVVPLGDGCRVEDEDILLGQCALTKYGDAIRLKHNAQALLCWGVSA